MLQFHFFVVFYIIYFVENVKLDYGLILSIVYDNLCFIKTLCMIFHLFTHLLIWDNLVLPTFILLVMIDFY
jgi:hypothetical protein